MDSPTWEPVWQGNGEAQARIVADGLGASGYRAQLQGARPIDGLPHAFQTNTWAVFVPAGEADSAREELRSQGEEAAIVEGESNWTVEQKSTLRFAGLMLLGCALFAVGVFLRRQL